MDKKIKEKWVAALRSGEYKQATCELRSSDNCFCCLGVLCDIIDNTWQEMFDNEGYIENYTFVYKNTNNQKRLPKSLALTYNISDDEQNELICLNDINGSTFLEIADYIEKNL